MLDSKHRGSQYVVDVGGIGRREDPGEFVKAERPGQGACW